MSVEGLDKCEMLTRNDTWPWSGPKDQQNKTCYLHLALCNFIASGEGHNFFFLSLVDPFFVNCIIFYSTPPQIPPGSFMISMASKDTFDGFTFAAFTVKNIPVIVAVIISPSLIESSTFFTNQSYSFYCIFF